MSDLENMMGRYADRQTSSVPYWRSLLTGSLPLDKGSKRSELELRIKLEMKVHTARNMPKSLLRKLKREFTSDIGHLLSCRHGKGM